MLTIALQRPATVEEWDKIWSTCASATYFHSREWAETWRDYSKGRIVPRPIMLVTSDRKQVLVPVSVQVAFKGIIKLNIMSPAGTFGGWLSVDELSIDHARTISQYLMKMDNLIWRVNPYDSLAVAAVAGIGQDDETHALDLANGFDQIYRNWTKGHSSAVRKARKEGVSVRLAADRLDWRAYYQVYEDSLRRWGDDASSRYEWPLFEQFACRNSPHVQLWLAEYQGKIIAGALTVCSKNQMIYWHGAALGEYFQLRPVNLLMYEVIKYACEQGFHWFDFNPSGGHEGVRAFKKSFGATPLSSPVIRTQTSASKVLHMIARIGNRTKALRRSLFAHWAY